MIRPIVSTSRSHVVQRGGALQAKAAADAVPLLLQASSVAFAAASAAVVVLGGTQSMLVAMLFCQLLVRTYGTELFTELVS